MFIFTAYKFLYKADKHLMNLMKANLIPQIAALRRHTGLVEILTFHIFPPGSALRESHVLRFSDIEAMDELFDGFMTKYVDINFYFAHAKGLFVSTYVLPERTAIWKVVFLLDDQNPASTPSAFGYHQEHLMPSVSPAHIIETEYTPSTEKEPCTQLQRKAWTNEARRDIQGNYTVPTSVQDLAQKVLLVSIFIMHCRLIDHPSSRIYMGRGLKIQAISIYHQA